jgi:prevent-host-death family protein
VFIQVRVKQVLQAISFTRCHNDNDGSDDMRRLSVAEVKRDFREVLDAAERGEATLVLRRGRPVAALVPAPSAARAVALPAPRRPGGLLALAGLLADWETIDDDVATVIASRATAVDRPPPELD